MKKSKKLRQNIQLTPDTQRRLVAYTAAAGMGAFFFGQGAEGQVTQSPGLGPYPRTMAGETITNAFSIMGDGITDFQFSWNGKGWSAGEDGYGGYGNTVATTYHPYGATYPGQFNVLLYSANVPRISYSYLSSRVGNFLDNPYGSFEKHSLKYKYQAYPVPWTVGMTNNSNAWEAGYYNYGFKLADGYINNFNINTSYLINNYQAPSYIKTGAGQFLGFTFVRTNLVSTNRFYGYMEIAITGTAWPDYWVGGYSATVSNMYYNATPNAGIIIGAVAPTAVKVTSINTGAANAVTINFTSTDGNLASAFTLQTSPSIGASASWATDGSAVITSSAPGQYQAVTTASGGIGYYRIIDN